MSKKSTESNEPKQPAYVDELLKNGTIVLMAKTRDDLAEMVNEIHSDTHYSVGAVGHNLETDTFTLRVDITL